MTSSSSPAAKLSAYLSQLNPVPTFPDYTGPYKVGTVDVEIPVTELESPSPAPESAADIYTVSCRIYYPAAPDSTGKPISWLPSPQRHHVSAYTQFVGIKPLLADFVSFLPRHLHYTTIPALKNADLLEPNTSNGRWPTMIFSHGLGGNRNTFLPRHLHYTTIPALKNADLLEPNTPNGRWPTMIFSHGLGGNRNTYSVVAGSLASHGIVVVCPEHRDGSAVASFVRIPQAQDSYFIRNTRRVVPYIRLPHDNTPEISTAREDQLRIRLWELGLAHAAILAIDRAQPLKNLNKSTPSLDFFAKKLHVHEPGSIIFAGHSFGSASIVQLLKSTYYAGSPALAKMERPLFTPAPDSELSKQITEKNVTMLLDMWCFPLLAPNSAPLFDLPLPAYANVPSAPGGKALLAVESDAFYKWTEHLHVTARVLSPDPSQKVITADLYQRNNGISLPEPNFFYVEKSAHLSQSDFGILFPWLTKRIFNSVEPERALRVNLRAQLQVLRANGVPVARTWVGDLVDGVGADKDDSGSGSEGEGEGEALLAVESDAFYKWTEHLHVTARVLSPDPSKKVITADLYQRNSGIALPEPNFFYVEKSAHLSQSDFGILFPWLTKRIFNSVEPERALRVNLRAQLQVLRANGVPVARTWVGDLVDGIGAEKDDSGSGSEGEGEGEVSDGVTDDRAIFLRSDGKIVDCWHWVETIGKGDEKKADAQAGESVSAQVADVEASAPQMEAEIEPPVVGRTVSASA
ncbi:hypothetical protein BN1723_013299 [Verticillium longisporum]|uniref:1-alkyl-2-acetylglycerophosphocholine esterase n=1 Tax=Verticillium longisporum TaxID=100787 RepID=A0A0G4LQT5_VERLO|nr:hypothetical protein BN1723_013299 [Verticillium longisporum]